MIKVYVLSERTTMGYDEWKISGIVTDFKVANGWITIGNPEKGLLHKYELVNFNDPELLNRIAKENSK